MILHETKELCEKVILVQVVTDDRTNFKDSLIELEELAKTSGVEVVGHLVQNLDKFNSKFYVGKGKLQELKDLISLKEATGIICDDELTSVQLKNMEEELETKVMDRTLVILDIFASRAITKEGKVQVELAQLKHRRSRLMGMGNALSKQGGGIGTKGPGEKKLELDKRNIDNRIVELLKELEKIVKHRETLRKDNKMTVVALVGYTNAGKSTLMNLLTDAKVLSEDKLFATLDTTTRKLEFENSSPVLLVDTVGFIQKLPHHLIQAFRSTLEQLQYADILLHVVDSSSQNRDEQMSTVYETLKDLKCVNKPTITVYNKIDLEVEKPLPIDENAFNTIQVSAKNEININELKNEIVNVLKTFKESIKVILPFDKGHMLNYIYKDSEIVKEEYKDVGIFLELYTTKELVNKLEKYIVNE